MLITDDRFYMKKIFLISILPAIVFLNGCNNGTASSPEDFTVTRLRSTGEVSPNPVNLSHCLLPGSKETLESFRHVSKGRLYYMDYDIDFPYEELIAREKEERIAPVPAPASSATMRRASCSSDGIWIRGAEI